MSIDVKICGIKTLEALEATANAGARFAGFVFCSSSRQAIAPADAASLAARAPAGMQKVGLFVDAGDEELQAVIGCVSIDLIQLHGNETPRRVAEIRSLTKLPVMMAICLSEPRDLLPIPSYETIADYLLFDTRIDGKPTGGSGQSFDWSLLTGRHFAKPWMLAGGLTAENLAEAVRISGLRIADVSTGVENGAGDKDPQKIREFMHTARGV